MIEFRVLGRLDLSGSEGEVHLSILAQPKRTALLAYLAVATPRGFHRRDKLLGLLWPDLDAERARGGLRNALYFLRQSLGDGVVVSRGAEEVGLAAETVLCDAVAFEEALAGGSPERALELYRGDLLEGFFLSEVPEFERWLERERERLRRLAAKGAWALADREEAAGNGVEAARWARRAVSFTPNDEPAFRRLLELLGRLGNRTGAIEEYEAFARRSREEYEAEPSPETQALIAAIREREVAAGGSFERPVELSATEPLADFPEPALEPPRPRQDAESRPPSVLRVLTTYALVSLAVLVAVHVVTLQFGLPDWFFPSAVVVLLLCLPIIVGTALVQGAAISARRADLEAERPSSLVGRWLTWRNAVGVTVAAFALLALAVSGYMAMRVMGIGPWGTLIARGVLDERDVIVLSDFENNTGDSILALTVTEAVRIRLEQSGVVRVADDDDVGEVLKQMQRDPDISLTYDLAREVAIRKGLKAVVSGEISRVGSGYVLSSRLTAAETGETLESFLEATDADAIMAAIDRLSAHLRERIGESLSAIRSSPGLGSAWTASLEAAQLRQQGNLARRNGEYPRAVDLYTRAIEIDSAFGEAYLNRAVSLGALGIERAQRIADVAKAYDLRENVPLRGRLFREALFYFAVTAEPEKAIEAYRAVLELRPDHTQAMNNLGLVYWSLRDYARAEEMFRRALEKNPVGPTWGNLTATLFDQGKYDEAEETLRLWSEMIPGHVRIPWYRAAFASARWDYDSAEVHFRNWRDLRPENLRVQATYNRYMGRLAEVQGRLAEAERYFVDAIGIYEERGLSEEYLRTVIELAGLQAWFRGDAERALQTVAEAIERYPLDSIEPLDRPYAELAGFYAFAGAPERARDWLVEWETTVPPDLRRTQEVARRAQWGAVALAEGRAEDALEEYRFVQERILHCPICGVPLLAQSYELAGQPDSALAMYEEYLATPYRARLYHGSIPADISPALGFDRYWLPVVYERLGDLYEQRDDTAKAILNYGKLVDVWKDADPELQPRVEAARRAIAALSPDR